MKNAFLIACSGALLSSLTPLANATPAPQAKPAGQLETVAQFYGAMPTGVTVSQKGRVFVNYPRWGDNVPFTVAEIVNGKEVPFPSRATNAFGTNGVRGTLAIENTPRAEALRRIHLVGVQSVVVDPKDRLWILDTGSIQFGPTAPGGAKMVCVDLKTNKVSKTIFFPANIALPTSYLNDVRFDLRKGREGVAYITDSGAASPGGIIVVDLASGRSYRRLSGHPSVQPEPKFVPFVEGRALFATPKGKFPKYLGLKSDGIAISADGSRLYYCPLASRHLYSVSTAALLNGKASDAVVASTVIDHGQKGMSDGLESDAQSRVYVTLPEQNAVARRYPNGLFETLVASPKLLWPDTLSVVSNGYVYVTANQLHRQKGYHYGKDLRVKPYSLFRFKVADATPVRLK